MAKKRAKPQRRPPSAGEAHQRRQERLGARRLARAEAEEQRAKAARRERLIRFAVIGLLAGGLVWFFLLQSGPTSPARIRGHRVQQTSESGVGEHVSETVDYDSTPPTHGPHGVAVECGVYAEPIPNENQVHNIEHGAIGIQYRPGLDPAAISRIEDIVRDYDSHVFSAPYSGMPAPIAVTSWGELMRLSSLDEPAVRDYIDAFRGQGPENIGCDNSHDDPFEPPEEGDGSQG